MSDEKFKMWVCQEDKHNKWWTYEISGNTVTTKFGRIGQDGQSSTKSFSDSWSRDSYANKKLSEKTAKGYNPVSKEQFDLLRLQAEIMGTGNKVEQTLLLIESGDKLFAMPNESAYDPSLKLCIGVVFRLRTKEGATEPYFIMFKDKETFEITNQRRIYPLTKPSGVKATPTEGWTVTKTKIGPGHALFEVVGKLETVLGSTL
jgi:predicted DNA-binding WGR domain protein